MRRRTPGSTSVFVEKQKRVPSSFVAYGSLRRFIGDEATGGHQAKHRLGRRGRRAGRTDLVLPGVIMGQMGMWVRTPRPA